MDCSVLAAARGVIRLANEHMARALRVISVERGYDPVDYTLLSFGGAGGLHACDLAELLAMQRVIIPARSGVLSALGMLVSKPGRELSQAMLVPLSGLSDEELGRRFEKLEAEAANQLIDEGCDQNSIVFKHRLELRYLGQSATISIDWVAGGELEGDFHRAHAKASGLQLPHPIELVNIRLSARAPAALTSIELPREQRVEALEKTVYMPELGFEVKLRDRQSLVTGEEIRGPCVLVEADATVWIKPAWLACADKLGNLMLTKHQNKKGQV